MRITIIAIGSRGDIQPYVALGAELRRRGHAVRTPVPPVFRPLIEGAGLEFEPVNRADPQAMLRRPEIQAAMRQRGQLRGALALLRNTAPMLQTILADYWRTTDGADLVVAPSLPFSAVDCAEARGVRCVHATLHALQPTRTFPNAFLAPYGPQLHHPLNRTTHHTIRLLMARLFGGELDRWRRGLGLPPLRGRYFAWLDRLRLTTLYGLSGTVLPRPDDWPAWHHITGYWFLDEPAWQPPADLLRFLADGPPPVAIGFGSMDDRDPERVTRAALGALEQSGQRGVLLSGWGGLGSLPLPPNVFRIEAAPHSWLFPRMAALVHHGGAGTTAAGLRAGVPAVITPVAVDQPFWAERVAQLGAGVRGQPFLQIDATTLGAQIARAAGSPTMRQRAATLADAIRAERGVERAADLIEAA
ncbi:MAG TPA: glycosyltransferase [Roseiflexaceae bacterium]|nr:glycosyltransferase [Roseiflexaceae bacterium]